MKLETIVQADGKEMNISDLDKVVKARIKEANIKLSQVEEAKAYVNVNEAKVYVVLSVEGKEICL